MDLEITYRGRQATSKGVEYITTLIAQNPDISRRALSYKLCEAWNWRQPNGHLRDMVCRGFLLCLDRAGHIRLPKKKCTPHNPFLQRKKPEKVLIDQTPVQTTLANIQPLEIQQVRRTPKEKLYNGLIAQYHYLGYCQPVGEHLKYIVFMKQRPIACFSFSSVPRHIGCRDKYIGWPAKVRQKNLSLIANNTRFLILPWVYIPCLGSHLLGRMVKVIATDWQRVYNHPLYFLETFVDTERFRGICYRAANWIYLGNTTGRGKNDNTHKPNRSIKAVFGYPLVKDFRHKLCQEKR
ncbi:MAG: DUF4338 domain-containing protein [Deltaproteobacteria bacterium]|nr:DUF4338 domain-containing protein [Deltaproteobacteria bacterium]